jgi:hypothetical protein
MGILVGGFGSQGFFSEGFVVRGEWFVGLAKVGPSSPTAPPRSALRYEILASA